MMRDPIIGITTYHRDEKGYIRLPGQYADAVRRAGGLPILLQPGETRFDQLFELLDGVVISGGGDIDPKRYHSETEEVYWVDKERDAFEFELTQRLLDDQDRPVFYICRGMQLLNVALGGTLIDHIPNVVPKAIDHRQPPEMPYGPIMHPIEVKSGTKLLEIMQSEQVMPASWHHQAVDRLGNGLEVVATAADGIIEAVELPDRPSLIAVQWHPELTAKDDPTQQRLFDELVENARQRLLAKSK